MFMKIFGCSAALIGLLEAGCKSRTSESQALAAEAQALGIQCAYFDGLWDGAEFRPRSEDSKLEFKLNEWANVTRNSLRSKPSGDVGIKISQIRDPQNNEDEVVGYRIAASQFVNGDGGHVVLAHSAEVAVPSNRPETYTLSMLMTPKEGLPKKLPPPDKPNPLLPRLSVRCTLQ